jgi:hypothetical protein
MKIHVLSICEAFNCVAIGTKVKNGCGEEALLLIVAGVEAHDASNDRVPGQHFIMLPKNAAELVHCGVAKRTLEPSDYINREHRGEMGQYMRRACAQICTGVAAVVYTKAAALVDEDVKVESHLLEEITSSDASHILVTLLAFGGPEGTFVSPHRFVANLAGGNKEYDLIAAFDKVLEDRSKGDPLITLVGQDSKSSGFSVINEAKQIMRGQRKFAAKVNDYNKTWCTVSD